MATHRIVVPVFLLGLLLLPACKSSVEGSRSATPRSAAVFEEIRASGAKSFIASTFEKGDWGEIDEGVASGDLQWLDVYVALKPESDAASSESLTIDLAYALSHSPEAVLRILSDESMSCGDTDPDDSEDHDFSIDLAELARRRTAVAAVTDPALASIREGCLAEVDHVAGLISIRMDGLRAAGDDSP
jgi:hypothetical protein